MKILKRIFWLGLFPLLIAFAVGYLASVILAKSDVVRPADLVGGYAVYPFLAWFITLIIIFIITEEN